MWNACLTSLRGCQLDVGREARSAEGMLILNLQGALSSKRYITARCDLVWRMECSKEYLGHTLWSRSLRSVQLLNHGLWYMA